MNSATAFNHREHRFDHPALKSYRIFGSIVAAMEHPGQLITIRENPYAPDIFNSASAAVCLTLLDDETPVWTDIDLSSPEVGWLQFGCGSSVVTEPCMAYLAIITKPATMPALDYFRISPYHYPEKATTIIVQVDDIVPRKDPNTPNIAVDRNARWELKGVKEDFWSQWQQLSNLDSLGIDIFFTCDDVLMALPRIKRIEA